MHRAWLLVGVLLLCWSTTGCAHRKCCAHGTAGSAPAPPLTMLLPEGERGALRMTVDSPGRPPDGVAHDYRTLSEIDCQCLAVQNSSLGNMLDGQRSKLMRKTGGKKPCDQMMINVLGFAALEARNRTAGGALELYYTIARLEAQRDNLDQSLVELDAGIADVERARREGLSVPLTSEDLTSQRIEAEKKRAELEVGLTRATRELAKLLGTEWGDTAVRIWPQTELTVVPQSFDVDREIAVAMATRPELQATQALASSQCVAYSPTLEAAISGYSAFLAASPLPGARLFGQRVAQRRNDESEVADRQQQFQDLAEQKERETRDDVRLAIATIDGRHDQAVFAQRLVLHWDERIVDVEKAREVNKSQPSDVIQAKLKRLEARSQLVDAITAWQIAQVKLREAQGRLVYECCEAFEEP